jgi:hypothetical protein
MERAFCWMREPFGSREWVQIDIECRNLISEIWDKGLETTACCYGHYWVYRNGYGKLRSGYGIPYVCFKTAPKSLMEFMWDRNFDVYNGDLYSGVYGLTRYEAVHRRLHLFTCDTLASYNRYPRFEAAFLEYLEKI